MTREKVEGVFERATQMDRNTGEKGKENRLNSKGVRVKTRKERGSKETKHTKHTDQK